MIVRHYRYSCGHMFFHEGLQQRHYHLPLYCYSTMGFKDNGLYNVQPLFNIHMYNMYVYIYRHHNVYIYIYYIHLYCIGYCLISCLHAYIRNIQLSRCLFVRPSNFPPFFSTNQPKFRNPARKPPGMHKTRRK